MNQTERTAHMSLQTFKRYEDKFFVDKEVYGELTRRLSEYMEFDEHCRNGTYKICNIYFDTENNDIMRLSTSKPYYKEKLRLRSYGTPQSPDTKVFLELKKKIGGIVNKRRAVMTYGEAQRYLSSGEKPKLDYLGMQVLSEIDWFLKNNPVKPAAYISYDRVAMFSKTDHDFRLTFDFNIETRRTRLSLAEGSFGKQLLPSDKMLMEVKISGALPLEIARIFSELGVYSTSFSKFGTEFKKNLSHWYDTDAESDKIAI